MSRQSSLFTSDSDSNEFDLDTHKSIELSNELKYDLYLFNKENIDILEVYKDILRIIDEDNFRLFENIKRSEDNSYGLTGTFKLNDNQSQEWLIIRDLLELTKIDQSLVVHLEDDFGCPLALELCDKLNFDRQADKRLFLHKGRIHFVPAIVKLNHLKTIYSKNYGRHFSQKGAAAHFIRDINRDGAEKSIIGQSSQPAAVNVIDQASFSKTNHLEIGKSILDKYSLDSETECMSRDDSSELFKQIPKVATAIEPVLQREILDIIDGLKDLEKWSKDMIERQSERLTNVMLDDKGGPTILTKPLRLSNLMRNSMREFDISPISTDLSSSPSLSPLNNYDNDSDLEDLGDG